jgi:hypothetical protein
MERPGAGVLGVRAIRDQDLLLAEDRNPARSDHAKDDFGLRHLTLRNCGRPAWARSAIF